MTQLDQLLCVNHLEKKKNSVVQSLQSQETVAGHPKTIKALINIKYDVQNIKSYEIPKLKQTTSTLLTITCIMYISRHCVLVFLLIHYD